MECDVQSIVACILNFSQTNYRVPVKAGEAEVVKEPVPAEVENNVLYVGNLPFSATEEDIKAIFPAATTVNIAKTADRTSKGFAFLSEWWLFQIFVFIVAHLKNRAFSYLGFASEEDMKQTFAESQNLEPQLNGRTLKVAERSQRRD
jgi:RNA recognition motif-containing protein